MEWFFAFVGLMVIIALIRLRSGSKQSKNRKPGSDVPVHYWMGNDAGSFDGGGGWDGGGESGGDSFDGGSSDGGGGDSSGF